jgi:hypothetical protein
MRRRHSLPLTSRQRSLNQRPQRQPNRHQLSLPRLNRQRLRFALRI